MVALVNDEYRTASESEGDVDNEMPKLEDVSDHEYVDISNVAMVIRRTLSMQ